MPRIQHNYGKARRGPILKIIGTRVGENTYGEALWHISIVRGTDYLASTTHYHNVSQFQLKSLVERALFGRMNKPHHVVWARYPIVEWWTDWNVHHWYNKFEGIHNE